MAGAAISILLQLAAVIPMAALYRQKNFSLKKEMLFGRFGKFLYILFFVLWGAVSFSNLWGVTKSVYFPINSSFTGAVILAAVCLYTAAMGIKALSRYSTFMTGLIVFSLIIMVAGALPKADLSNFSPNGNFSSIAKSVIHEFCSSGELVMMFVLLEFIPKERSKGITRFFAGKFILTELIAVIEITILGRIMRLSDYPFF
jgi:hypothetical protein